tara:strand:- start:372 stop:1637 length:1266 start_codon:yes stop_codon:yes gene_type:complete
MDKNLDKLLAQLIKLHPKYIDLSLKRILNLLKKIGNPHLDLPPTIHIAGTNGKGSTLSYIRYILMENGFNTHAYISPHLKSFSERIIIQDKQIKLNNLIKAIKYVRDINNGEQITFFEIITATAFYLYSKEKADFLILETGLGGRLDATNVVKNTLMNIITPISIDHQEYLGKSILKITNEKLGIIKEGSTVIFSKQKKIINKYISEKLKKNKNEKLFFDKDYKIIKKDKSNFSLKYKNKIYIYSNPRLMGEHQIENASTAILAILKLKELGYKFSKKNIQNGIKKTKWPGRLEKFKVKNTEIYLDGAHNIDGANQLLKFFNKKKIKIWLIIGMLNNKDIKSFLKKLKPILAGVIGVSIPDEINSYSTKKITDVCNELKIRNYAKISVDSANIFLREKIKHKYILVSGSLYLVGKIRNKYL